MELSVRNDQPWAEFSVLTSDGQYRPQKFLVDTGFTEICIFPINPKAESIDLEFSDIRELPEDRWAVIANGEIVRTFRATVAIQLKGKRHIIEVLLMEAKENDCPMIGMRFLREYQQRLVLDFKKKKFQLT